MNFSIYSVKNTRDFFKKLRERNNLSYGKLAQLTGMQNKGFVHKVIFGEKHLTGLDAARRIADNLKLDEKERFYLYTLCIVSGKNCDADPKFRKKILSIVKNHLDSI